MTLASQTVRTTRVAGPGGTPPRPGSGIGGGNTGGPGRRRMMVAGGAVLTAAIGIWGLSHLFGGGPRSAGAAENSSGAPDPAATASANGAVTPPTAPPASSLNDPTIAGRNRLAVGGVALQPKPPETPPVVLEMNKRPDAAPAPATITAPATSMAGGPVTGRPATATPPGSATLPPSSLNSAPPIIPSSNDEVGQWIAAGERLRQDGKLVEARRMFNQAMLDERTPESDREGLRQLMSEINQTLLFSPAVAKDDSLTDTYVIKSGDVLEKVVRNQSLGVDKLFLARINKMSDPNRLSVGQKIKLARGPFHVVVHKSEFRLDLYAGPPPAPSAISRPTAAAGADSDWIYIRSFKVGLGEHGGTPLGTFIVKPHSKLKNPPWVNPRTGEKFAANDPKNPIGEHWLGLEGADDQTRPFTGYGLHGTIDPSSIGKEMSMGCVRMAADDIAVVWEMLQDGVSVVRILP